MCLSVVVVFSSFCSILCKMVQCQYDLMLHVCIYKCNKISTHKNDNCRNTSIVCTEYMFEITDNFLYISFFFIALDFSGYDKYGTNQLSNFSDHPKNIAWNIYSLYSYLSLGILLSTKFGAGRLAY